MKNISPKFPSFRKIILLSLGLLTLTHCCVPQIPGERENLFTYQFKSATAISIDPSGNIFVLDAGTNELLKFDNQRKFIQKIGGSGWTDVSFDKPTDVISPNGLDVYVADYGNHRIQRFDKNLNFVSTLSLLDNSDPFQHFGYPRGIAVDRYGALYIIDGENTRIVKIKGNSVERVFGGIDAGSGRLHRPSQIRINESDHLFILDDGTIVEYDIFGNFIRRYEKNLFTSLQAIAVVENNLIVLDSNHAIVFENSLKDTFLLENPLHDSLPFQEVNDVSVYKNTIFVLTNRGVKEFNFYRKSQKE
ncbi:MAG: hypothetical protein EPO24_01430 [Bacteroidetes bacterium]|nr:MAG: hypothetical protein EPO24_01430 [Bacteroidota bacterium]